MSSTFPKIPIIVDKNVLTGKNFDVIKRNSMETFFGNEKNVFKFNCDRFIPTRNDVRTEFLRRKYEEAFDISLSENDLRTMKKIQYQSRLRAIFNEEQEVKRTKGKKNANQLRNEPLIHFDWACKLINIREKFYPDFETLEKKNFYHIRSYLWSSQHIIAAASNKKVCLYHPLNGFTRALDIESGVTLAFSKSGDHLAMAYRKSRKETCSYDLIVFKLHSGALFNSEKLKTEKISTVLNYDITALCYTGKNDNYLMCGTSQGVIFVLECSKSSADVQKWEIFKTSLSEKHSAEIRKISFSASSHYMATLDSKGVFKIWNGGSWTYIYSFQSEEYSLIHLEWHPYVENELIFGRAIFPAIYLFNVTQRKVIASYACNKGNWILTSVCFNPVTAQLAVCFYDDEEYINRVSILASMSQVISTFDFDYIDSGLKLFWNDNGTMLGAGARTFRFAFWSFSKNRDFSMQMFGNCKPSKNSKKLLSLGNTKFNCIR